MKILNNQPSETKVFALGGLGEVGKNMYVIEHNNEIIIIDAGIIFPDEELLGIDYVLPDYTYLKKNEEKIKALFITHGHEDHIGAVSFLVSAVNIPMIYAPKQAYELLKLKLLDRNVKYDRFTVYTEESKIKFKFFEVEFFLTTHSIPDSHGIVIHTPNGTIVETGDFKFDMTPIGPMANLHKIAEVGKRGVKLLLSDSTNAQSEGFSISESKVDEALGDIFKREQGRIIIATFASNIYRLKHIIETCKENNRKVALFGRSMKTSIEIAINGGYINAGNTIVDENEVVNLPKEEACLLCTGSQGEALAALSRIANGSHPKIKLMSDDVVIFSSNPIPGNSASISKTVNLLCLKGVKVYTNALLSDIHASGHAKEEELKLMLRLIKPEFFMPMHGEYRMLKAHADLAIECGVLKKKTFILQNGDILRINKAGIRKEGSIPVSDIYVDGNRIGDIGNVVLRDRKIMANDGIFVIIFVVNQKTRQCLNKPMSTSRGFILVNENANLVHEIETFAFEMIKKKLETKSTYNDIKSELIYDLSPFIFEKTGRKPIILPVIMDIK